MFSLIRRLLKHSAVYGIGHVLSRVVSFLLLPYLTHTLTPEEYGGVMLLYTFIAVALAFYVYGFDISFLRYYILQKDPEKRKEIFGTIFLISLATSGLFSIVIGLSTGALASVVFENPQAVGVNPRYLILLGTGILLTDTLGTYPYLWLRSVEKSVPFITLKAAGVIVHVVLTIFFISVLKRGVNGVFEANLIASASQFICLLPVIMKNISFSIRLDQIGEFFRFGIPAVPSQTFVMVVELSDRKILEILMGLGVVGLYSAGYKLGLFMAVVTMGFRFAWQPFFLSIADREDAKETFARVFTYYLLITGALFLLLAFTIEPLMTKPLPLVGTLIERSYWEGLKVFPVILLAHICNGAAANFMVGVYLKKKTGIMPVITGIGALINVGLNFAFIPMFGMMAAAWATCIAYLAVAVALYLLIQPHYHINYEWNRILTLLVCGGATYAVSTLSFWQPYWYLKLVLLPAFLGLLFVAKFFIPEEISAVQRRLLPKGAS